MVDDLIGYDHNYARFCYWIFTIDILLAEVSVSYHCNQSSDLH